MVNVGGMVPVAMNIGGVVLVDGRGSVWVCADQRAVWQLAWQLVALWILGAADG